ncbi:MAG TPA: hypothetical protein VGY76_14325 [Solirubrobacteraceae bacterium]|nr:hypothetical protein [Solirubrobacteraceae bacterium]
MIMLKLALWRSIVCVSTCTVVFVTVVGSASGSFGLQAGSFENLFLNEGNVPAVQAGAHPVAVTTSFKFNRKEGLGGGVIPDEDVKDIEVELPVGLVGNPGATPKCTYEKFTKFSDRELHVSCPNDSQVGVAVVELGIGGIEPFSFGIYNLVAPPGVPAEFALSALGVPVLLTPRVRTGSDYGVTVVSKNTNQGLRLYGVKTTFWGVPSDPSHDGERGKCLGILGRHFALGEEHPCPVESNGPPFLTLPTNCQTSPLATTIYTDSWQHPVPFALNLEEAFRLGRPEVIHEVAFNHDGEGHPLGVTGCDHLDFSPTVGITPSTSAAGSPTGLSADISLPQNETHNGLAEADLKKAVVSLPAEMTVSPSAANGREGCSEEQIALRSMLPAHCPDASKVGTVEIETPLLEHNLEGSVFLAQPNANEFHSLLALYLVAEGSGVVIKLAGEVHADPVTGQLTTTFDNNPQQPFSHLRLKFFNGPRAALMTPRRCGSYAATGALTPWSGEMPATFFAPFAIETGCGGGFSPSMVAGTIGNQAGGFSPLSLTLTRSDQDQAFRQLSVRTPPGLLGMLSKVKVCEEPLIAQQACPKASQIGHVTVAAGPGSDPVYLPQAGKPEDPVYLTSGYNGAPFGLLTVVHAEAGPFNLGTVPVRTTLNVDRRTSRIVATTDPLPTILQGIPVDLKTINILIDREGFTFNPTDCEPLKFEGAVLGDEGATASVSSRFQAANCATLAFKPKFSASTKAHPSHTHGASLTVKVGYPKGAQANIAAVKVSLPKQLPSRLTTLQKACPEATFAANPATCPAESLVGSATATTPVLNVPVTGPAYLVSHGGAAFPDLIMILQGQGVTVELVGNTFVNKAGITTSTFASVPDVPISSFEVNLPQGPHSALTENLPKQSKGNFCSAKLAMPTTITAQNGLQIKQSTKITVSGCPKIKARKAKAHSHQRK